MSETMTVAPCPFCGSAKTYINDALDTGWVVCEDCHGEGPTAERKAEAVAKWNAVGTTASRCGRLLDALHEIRRYTKGDEYQMSTFDRLERIRSLCGSALSAAPATTDAGEGRQP